MALTLEVDRRGSAVHLGDWLGGYQIVEDATPIVPTRSGSGTGGTSFTIAKRPEAKLLRSCVYDFEDVGRGTTRGVISVAAGSLDSVSLSGQNSMAAFVTNVQAQPFHGTLQEALAYYFSLAGVVDDFVIDPALASRQVVHQGFFGSLWSFLSRELAPAEGFDLDFVSNRIVVRGRIQREVVTHRDIQLPTWTQDDGQLARSIKVAWYEQAWNPDTLVYPRPSGWDGTETIMSVEAGEVAEFEFEVETSIASIDQPQPVDTVLRHATGNVYSVTGSDNLPVTAAQWTATGGRLEVEVGQDTRTIIVRITGPAVDHVSPYRIAVSDGSGDYSSLRIRGAGVTSTRHDITLLTGLTEAEASTDVGVEIDSRAIRTKGAAYDIGAWALLPYLGAAQQLAASARSVHKSRDDGSYRKVTIDEFNAMPQFAGKTIAQVNAILATTADPTGEAATGSIDAVNAWLASTIANEFENQAFGNVAGSRVLHEECLYRITTATLTQDAVAYQATKHTTIDDVNKVFAGKTIAQVNTLLAGATIDDVNTAPLRSDWR